MRILAIETTEKTGSLAATEGGQVLAERSLDAAQRSAQSLVPGLKTLLEAVSWQPTDVDLVAVTRGPGSFTGLRIGITTAKTFAYVANCDIVGVDTLQAIAWGCPDSVDRVAVALDAQRGDVAARTFRRSTEGFMTPDGDELIIPFTEWLDTLPAETPVTGPIFGRKRLHVPEGLPILEEQYWHPSATQVARLAEHLYQQGQRDDVWRLAPHYSRLSAAEEKWAEKNASK